jgi:predicted DNA-binding protein (MmcQ/YjbR family)
LYTREEIISMALELPGSAADTPFEGDGISTVLRHGDTGKWFGLVFRAPRNRVGLTGEGWADILNLKCDPLVSYGLMQEYPDILPAWHMNKQLWITVRLEGNVPRETLELLMRMSFDLTSKKKRLARAAKPK